MDEGKNFTQENKEKKINKTEELFYGIEKNEDNSVTVHFKDVNLTEENPVLGHLQIEAEKKPLEISEGESFYSDRIDFNEVNQESLKLEEAAEKLKEISDERLRIDDLLDLFKNKVTYGYQDVIDKKARVFNIPQEDMDLFGTKGNAKVEFSDMVKYGVGICGHLSAGYLHLAYKAGLKGILVHSNL